MSKKISASPQLIVGISGASGAILGIRFLEALREVGVVTHLVVSAAGRTTLGLETDCTLAELEAKADHVYNVKNIAAAISSGSFLCDGMAVVPCSIRTMSEIATGVTSNLLTRAADVTLKERRPLLLAVRETPLHLGHLRTMTALSEMGAIIMPPVPAFYTAPKTIHDIVDQTVARMLDAFGYRWAKAKRWGSPPEQDASED